MRRTLTILAVAMALPAGAAFADDDCRVPIADWQPRDAVLALASQKGWTVTRVKVDDGCYEIRGNDSEGHRIEVKIDPGSLDLVEMKTRYRDLANPLPRNPTEGSND
ncbi:MAG: PepSY domain-containing protein [Rhodobacteraceae bacterium]|nr:PepSY domain-containing protein [Paracoccaceae bacterium]